MNKDERLMEATRRTRDVLRRLRTAAIGDCGKFNTEIRPVAEALAQGLAEHYLGKGKPKVLGGLLTEAITKWGDHRVSFDNMTDILTVHWFFGALAEAENPMERLLVANQMDPMDKPGKEDLVVTPLSTGLMAVALVVLAERKRRRKVPKYAAAVVPSGRIKQTVCLPDVNLPDEGRIFIIDDQIVGGRTYRALLEAMIRQWGVKKQEVETPGSGYGLQEGFF